MTISEKFAELKANNQKALITYVTGGDPSLDALPDILRMLEESGVDLIEVGIPYSDPIADGPTIQASSQRALDKGTSPQKVFSAIKQANLSLPVLVMTYANVAVRMGYKNFLHQMKDAGVSGSILSDLSPEHAREWTSLCGASGVDCVFLVAPTSTEARLKTIADLSSGFIYAVSRTGVTGAREQTSSDARDLVSQLKAQTDKPVCVGFGISSSEQVKEVWEYADGAVVGSWLVDLLAREWESDPETVSKKVKALKA